jgi:hypothetical protein
MQQYAVTVVFYVSAEDIEEAQMVAAVAIQDNILNKDNNESWSIVDTTEVKF